MSRYAYIDEDRKQKCYAQNIKDYEERYYYCPNKKCEAHLYLCAFTGKTKPYFRATRSKHKHIDNCQYLSSALNYNYSVYDESKFNYDEALDNLISPKSSNKKDLIKSSENHPPSLKKGSPKESPIRTLRAIYAMYLGDDYEVSYGGTPRKDMIIDSTTLQFYGRVVKKIIVVAEKARCCYKNEQLECYLVLKTKNKEINFVLSFKNDKQDQKDDKLYKEIRNKIYNTKYQKIVVAGEWQQINNENKYKTIIKSRKQIYIDNLKNQWRK